MIFLRFGASPGILNNRKGRDIFLPKFPSLFLSRWAEVLDPFYWGLEVVLGSWLYARVSGLAVCSVVSCDYVSDSIYLFQPGPGPWAHG